MILKNLFLIFVFAIFATFSFAHSKDFHPIHNNKSCITNIKIYDNPFDIIKETQPILHKQLELLQTKSHITQDYYTHFANNNSKFLLFNNQTNITTINHQQQYIHNDKITTNTPRAP